jgi:hypothetical protein
VIVAGRRGVFTRNASACVMHASTNQHPRGDDMRKSALLLLSSVVLVGGLLAAGPASMASGHGSRKILKFHTMASSSETARSRWRSTAW